MIYEILIVVRIETDKHPGELFVLIKGLSEAEKIELKDFLSSILGV